MWKGFEKEIVETPQFEPTTSRVSKDKLQPLNTEAHRQPHKQRAQKEDSEVRNSKRIGMPVSLSSRILNLGENPPKR